ncbi:MAG: hypothetical protein VW378_00605 [bacterium]
MSPYYSLNYIILRPSFIIGKRKEKRRGEGIAHILAKILLTDKWPKILASLTPIIAQCISHKMIQLIKESQNTSINDKLKLEENIRYINKGLNKLN